MGVRWSFEWPLIVRVEALVEDMVRMVEEEGSGWCCAGGALTREVGRCGMAKLSSSLGREERDFGCGWRLKKLMTSGPHI